MFGWYPDLHKGTSRLADNSQIHLNFSQEWLKDDNKMNTRRQLRALFEEQGFKEAAFAYVANCTTFHSFRATMFLELSLWRMFRTLGITYPESNLLGVYEKVREE